jgi:hypothetical protein
VLLALLLGLIDPVPPVSAATATTVRAETAALTAAEPAIVASVADDLVAPETPQGVPLILTNVFQKEDPAPQVRFLWREHPSVRAGRNFRLDFGLKVQEVSRDPGDGPTPLDADTTKPKFWTIASLMQVEF